MIGRRLALAGAVLAALTLAGCGDSSDPVEPPATPAATPVAEAAPPAIVAPPAEAAPPIAIAAAPGTPVLPETPTAAVATAPDETAATTPPAPEPAAPIATPPAAAAPPVTPTAAATTPAALPPPTQELLWLQQPPFTNPAPAVAAAPATATVPAPAVPATAAETPVVVAQAPTLGERLATANPADGAVYLMQCEICHTVDQGGATGIGPNLFGIVGAPVGRDPAFAYSPAFQALAAAGATWTPERLDAFLAAPGAEIPGTRMGFGGFDDPDTRADVIAWLASLVAVAPETPEAPQIVGLQMPGLGPVSYLAVQADVGAIQYVTLGCDSCHGADMRSGVASPLVGPDFAERWFVRPVFDFLVALKTMPPNDPAGFADGRYLELLAAILAANGFEPGAIPLRANPATLQATGFYQPVDQRRDR
ncbi:MAG: c-type cytochrome [Bauldia sp.]